MCYNSDMKTKDATPWHFERLGVLSDGDAAQLRKLAFQLTPDAQFDVRAIRRSMRTGATLVFVLRSRARIVASLSAGRFSTPTGAHCRLEDVVVDEKWRGRGLGREIVERALAALHELGVGQVELTSRPSRVAANTLYRTLGFARRKTNVYALPETYFKLKGDGDGTQDR